MKKANVSDNDIYVNVTFDCKDNVQSEYRYNLSLYGAYELEDLRESEVREIIDALSSALQLTQKEEKGGAQ